MIRKTAAMKLFCMALLTLVGVAALAADNKSNTITINGGRDTVLMKAPSNLVKSPTKPAANSFYDNIRGDGYNPVYGFSISKGSPIGQEDTPASQFISLKSGTTKTISVGVGYLDGENGAIVDLDNDCRGVPCGNPYGSKHLCRGKITNLPVFGSTAYYVESIKCKVKLVKGKPYWVYVQGIANSYSAWNYNVNFATGFFMKGSNGAWGSREDGIILGAMTIE
jgi:hypothetical protein